MSHSQENQLLLAVARKPLTMAIDDIPRLAKQVQDWDYTLAAAGHHGLSPLLFQLISDAGATDSLDANTSMKLRTSYLTSLMNAQRQLKNFSPLIDAFAAREIPLILMKGPVLGLTLYNDIGLRPFGDIDILIPRNHIAEGKLIMKESGYQLIENNYFPIPDEKNEEFGCEWSYHKDGFVVELHWGIISRLAPFSIDIDFYWKNNSEINFDGRKVLIMNPGAQLMHLCLHQFKHHWKHLRDLTDIALVLQKHADSINWDDFVRSARTQGLGRCAYYNLFLAHRVLGATVPSSRMDALIAGHRPGLMASAMASTISENILENHLPRRLWEVILVEGAGNRLKVIREALAHPFPRKGGRSQVAPTNKTGFLKRLSAALKTAYYYRGLVVDYLRHVINSLRRRRG